MDIITPRGPRGLPPIDEIKQVVSVVCDVCGFPVERVALTIVGGRHLGEHKGVGIRLMKPQAYTVMMFVGCKTDTAEVYFQVRKPESKHAEPGEEVFNRLLKGFNNQRVFRVTDDMIRERERREREKRSIKQNGANGNGHAKYTVTTRYSDTPASVSTLVGALTAIAAPRAPALLVEPSGSSERIVEEVVADSIDTTPTASSESSVTPQPSAPTKRYEKHFDDPANLHLTAMALASIVDGSTAKPFNLKEFATALEQSNVPGEAGIPQSILYKFMRYGFLERINPDGDRGVYNVTDALIRFASAPVPLELPPFMKSDTSTSGNVPVKPAPASKQAKPVAVKETLASLKLEEARYHALLDEKRKTAKALEDLEKENFDATEERVRGEIKSYEKRIGALKDDLVRIGMGRKDIQQARSKLGDLDRQIADPELAAALSELAEIRKMLS